MKPIKMLGLAALAALMAMAFAGAGSAIAEPTTLCEEDSEASCGKISHVHETSVSKAKLLSSIITVECDVLFLGDTGGLASPLEIEGNFTYSNCGSCTAFEENGPATIKVLRTSHETAKVTGEGQVHIECGAFIDCIYNGTGLVGTGKGVGLSTQLKGEVTLSEQVTNKVGGFGCPSTAKLDIQTTPLEHTYIIQATPHTYIGS